jgi:16S rRNA (adenine1518-N6/adenine1519-N6)-dimethyltransferase
MGILAGGGPGLGILTAELSQRAGRVISIEIDRDLVAALKRVLPPSSPVEIVEADVLQFDPSKYFPNAPYKVVANLPYYITSPTLRHFLEASHKPTVMVLMVQKEVAERIVAQPGEMSLLAISVQLYGDARIVRFVPSTAFYPSPKVDSAILHITVYPKPIVDVDPEKLFRVVSAGFAQSRKQLHNSLSQAIWMPPGEAPGILREAGVDEKRRPQTLSLEEWAGITRLLEQRGYV